MRREAVLSWQHGWSVSLWLQRQRNSRRQQQRARLQHRRRLQRAAAGARQAAAAQGPGRWRRCQRAYWIL